MQYETGAVIRVFSSTVTRRCNCNPVFVEQGLSGYFHVDDAATCTTAERRNWEWTCGNLTLPYELQESITALNTMAKIVGHGKYVRICTCNITITVYLQLIFRN